MREASRPSAAAVAGAALCLAVALPGAGGTAPGVGGSAAAQETAVADRDTIAAADTGRVSFDFQNAGLRVVLTALAEAADMSIVYSDLPDRTVTLRTAEPVPPSRVRVLLQSVVEANGLAMKESAGVVRVYVPEEAPSRARGEEQDGEQRRTAEERPPAGGPPRLYVHRLAHADASTVSRTLRTLFGLGGGGSSGAGAGRSSGAASLSERLRMQEYTGHRSYVEPGDRRGRQVRRLPARPPGAPADRQPQAGGRQEEREGRGTSVLLHGPVEIVPDPRTNSILILANPADFETVKAAIEKLDRRPLQVLIEVLIVEVSRTDNLNINTTGDVPATEEADDEESAVGGSLSAMGNVALEVLGLGPVDASAVLNVLSQSTEATILSRPVVLAQNNEEARILVGDQRPFVQLSRATEGGAVDQVVAYQSVGTELRIRPTINRDGFVDLEVLQEVSSATQVTQFNAPVINTRESETDVLVRDGHTVVLGGLVDRETERSRSGIPLLKDIPLIGGLFGSTSRRDVASELFILLTPHVLHTDADMDAARRQLQRTSDMLEEELPDTIPLIRLDSLRNDVLPSPDTASPAATDTLPAVPDALPLETDALPPTGTDSLPSAEPDSARRSRGPGGAA